MILTRAPSRAPFTLVVKITPGPQTCSRATVGSPASGLRYACLTRDHRLGLASASDLRSTASLSNHNKVVGAAKVPRFRLVSPPQKFFTI